MTEEIRSLIVAPWSSYAEAKERSAKIDGLLGFRLDECESALRPRADRADWAHLPVQAFQTPYPELAQMTRRFAKPAALDWVDLGAGYGRLGLVLAALRPQDRYLGIEFVSERVREGHRIIQKWSCPNARLIDGDLTASDFILPEADVYFLFDFAAPEQVDGLLARLRRQISVRPFAVLGRGRGTRHLIATGHAWLSAVEEPLHTEHWSLYRHCPDSPGGPA